jgi:hypothetical protein
VPDNVRGEQSYGKCHRKYTVPLFFSGIRVKWCVLRSSGIKVRAHRASSNGGGMTNPTESKTM